ncbi:YhbY family RNA-binding protein [Paraburkholderia phenoliruptrix]|uniref:YhbY family RNA-binding protein n=1 Tax=Paraburkholderia phenoliruptrix TaxID=252970 RepID=UPI001C6ECA2B|nr:YhbY family RNA-binding protein [Paraburkholderia phenoliruptrix]MBW9106488.1 YhbY family RNA-binding protein [Paraburkholderia phenoliruptrix]MBW9131464.1 YhbY family RNA-binding protein [Paraburkholderia ginsengiterrae]
MPALKVSSDQRAELRSQAHALKPVVLVGAEGLTDAVLAEIKVHLAAHQLIKIRVFGDEREERIAIYEQICDKLNAAPIQHIGKLLVIWKPEAAAQPAPKGKRGALRGALPSAREAAVEAKASKGRAPRVVKVVKPSEVPMRKPKAKAVLVRGNERVTQGGNIKRAKKRQTSSKRAHQSK